MLVALPVLPLTAHPSHGNLNLGPPPPSQVTGSSPTSNEDKNNVNWSPPPSVATHTRTIGIIHPPPFIRTIVDKTAQFIAKKGPEWEKKILADNVGKAKLNFLNGSDPYNAYYQHRLSEFRTQNQRQIPLSQPAVDSSAPEASTNKPDPLAQFKPVPKVLEPPEAEQYTVRLPGGGITGEELDIIKLTAQFVALNGKSFLTGLTSREINNPQFQFLKPTHSMFMFFTALVDAYSKVLKPPITVEKHSKRVVDMTTVLERCLDRLEWERSQEQVRQKALDEIELERMQMAMTDWHDFVVVETIEFADGEDEDLPPPMTLEDVIRRGKASIEVEEEEVVEPGNVEVDMEMDEEEVQLVAEGMRAASIFENDDENKTEALEEPEQPMRIVKNWKRPEETIAAQKDPRKIVVSPITGQLIPINEMAEHMRISLIDPKYKEQKERMMAKLRETTLAHDDEISRNIVGLARTRPDIFGTTEEEVSDAVKAEIEKKKEEQQPKKVIWDGDTGSIGRTANQAMPQNLEDDAGSNEARGLPGAAAPPPKPGVPSVRPLPPPPGGLPLNIPCMGKNTMQYTAQTSCGIFMPPPRPHMVSMGLARPFIHLPGPPHSIQMMPLPPPPEEAPPLPEEPEAKRQRVENFQLIPEEQFLAQHPDPVRITVSVPNMDELTLKGNLLEITVHSLSETVGNLKEKIAGEVQLPANKQKLSGRAGFLKDNLSLAYYNITAGETLTLALRERGGRKR